MTGITTPVGETAARQIEYAALLAKEQLAAAIAIADERGVKGEKREAVVLGLLQAIALNCAALRK